MGLTAEDFGAFFAAVHKGHRPFAWQQRLLDSVVADGRWPSRIIAPTGAGKTSVIDVHVFAQALTAADGPMRRPPRRLSMVVGRRVLVDDQYEHARELSRRLSQPNTELLARVAELLWSLHPARAGHVQDDALGPASPLVVARLRGGQAPSLNWRDHPTSAAVICATPDMWGSRLLFRGYGSSARAWPREAGLLAFDSVVVVDEAHLARQLLCTARRVGELTQVAARPLHHRGLQVVETTATPQAEGPLDVVGVEPADLIAGDTLASRLTRPKPVRVVPAPGWDSTREPQRRKVAAVIADAVEELRKRVLLAAEPASPTVGCFVNTVHRAIDVAAELRRRDLRVVLICGQVRPFDLQRLRQQHPGVLSSGGSPDVDVLVTTQSLEVGVDLDLAGVVTELASGSALVQRAGRVNRRGLRTSGPFVVVVPAEEITERTRSGPYVGDELNESLDWLGGRAADSDGVSPWRLRENKPPAARPRRRLFQRPELAEAWHWARTSEQLAAEPELDLWLAEDFETDTSVSFVVRRAMPTDAADAVRLLRALPPMSHEEFGVPLRTALDVLRQWRHDRGKPPAGAPAAATLVVRSEDIAVLDWVEARDGTDELVARIRPGDIIVFDEAEKLFTASVAGRDGGFSPPVVAPAAGEGVRLALHEAQDVSEALAELADWDPPRNGTVVLRLESEPGSPPESDPFREIAGPLGGRPPESVDSLAGWHRDLIRAWLADSIGTAGASAMGRAALDLLDGDARKCEVIIHWGLAIRDDPAGSGPLVVRVLLRDRRRALGDTELRQIFSPVGQITLDQHQSEVSARATSIAEALGLEPVLVEALRLAGLHHDDGKLDERFQGRLGWRDGPPLAKSRSSMSPEQARANEGSCGLPRGWRHEQLSVVQSWDALHDPAGRPTDPQLAARLVGTSHGHGRSAFPHTGPELVADARGYAVRELAVTLYDLGGWDELMEGTQQRYGVWGCAYLEALLRAADSQVSEEGS